MNKAAFKELAKLVVKFVFKWSGPQGWITSIFLAMFIEKGWIAVEDAIDKKQDEKAVETIKEITKVPYDQVDKDALDKAEREILEGKK